VVFADGTMEGWVGGGCIKPTARREALTALEEGTPRLLRITPDTAATQPGVRLAQMTCASEGTADLYVEPFLPRPTLLVVGDSPVATTLAAIAPPLGFRLLTLDAQATVDDVPYPQDTWMAVATFGEADEDAVEAGVRLGLPYVGLVASERRAGEVLDELRARGLDDEALRVVRSPAGLPTGTGGQEGISVSIIAEIFALRAKLRPGVSREPEAPETTEATDPVCGMIVEVASARHAAGHAGERYYFCCSGCKRAFESEPGKYVGRIHA
jgi:xanthine dehydrogenase accessory factor